LCNRFQKTLIKGSIFVNILNERQRGEIFTVGFPHIYQECWYWWSPLYESLVKLDCML